MLKPIPKAEWLKAARRAGVMLKRGDSGITSIRYIRRVLDTSPYNAATALRCMDVNVHRSEMERACAMRLLMHREDRTDQLYLMGVL